jgi:hypothetical protein
VLVTAACALAGCGTGGADAQARAIPLRSAGSTSSTSAAPSSTTTTVAVATTTTATPHLLGVDPALVPVVWSDYEAAMRAGEAAASRADPNDPGLRHHHTGAELSRLIQLNAGLRARGEYASFAPDSRHGERLVAMARLDDSRIDLTTCVLDDAIVRVRDTGEVVNDHVSLAHVIELMVQEDGVWKLAARDIRRPAEGECSGM